MSGRPDEIDELTLRRAARGDRDAATSFVRRYERLVFSTAARVLGAGSPDVADVAQETFLRALPALAGFDPVGSARVSTWLSTIAARVAIDASRRRRNVVSLDEARGCVDEAPSPDAATDEAARRARLKDAMERLGADQRAAMVLRVEHELSLEEIARALGVEVGTVKSRLARAKAALSRALLGEHAAAEGRDARRS